MSAWSGNLWLLKLNYYPVNTWPGAVVIFSFFTFKWMNYFVLYVVPTYNNTTEIVQGLPFVFIFHKIVILMWRMRSLIFWTSYAWLNLYECSLRPTKTSIYVRYNVSNDNNDRVPQLFSKRYDASYTRINYTERNLVTNEKYVLCVLLSNWM